MTNRTIQEIQGHYSERASTLINDWYGAKSDIARAPESVEGPHADLLTNAQRAEAVYQQKAERARTLAEEYRREYLEAVEEHNDAVRSRTRSLHKEVYALENADVLSRVALATDAQLGAMLELAATTGSAELGRAVFIVAEQRQLGEITNPRGLRGAEGGALGGGHGAQTSRCRYPLCGAHGPRLRASPRQPLGETAMQRKSCPACNHPERPVYSIALRVGQAPRSVVRRYAGLNRKVLQTHRDLCLREEEPGAA